MKFDISNEKDRNVERFYKSVCVYLKSLGLKPIKIKGKMMKKMFNRLWHVVFFVFVASCGLLEEESVIPLQTANESLCVTTVRGVVCVNEYQNATEMLQRAINMTPNTRRTTHMPIPIELPWGATLVLSQGVVVDRPILLRGNGSRLQIGQGVTALTFTPNADRSVVEDLRIEGPETLRTVTDQTDNSVGIRVEAHGCFFNRIHVTQIGFGIKILSGAAGDHDEEYANANFNNIQGLWGTRSGTVLFVEGPDANGGLFQQIECANNRRCVHDSSFLGNTYINPSSHITNEIGFDFDEFAAYPVIVAPYSEGTAPNIRVMGRNALIVGGTQNSRITEDTRADRIGGRGSRLRFQFRNGPVLRVPQDIEGYGE